MPFTTDLFQKSSMRGIRMEPCLNVYFVTCEDLEVYRTTLKPKIKTWTTMISARKSQEWLIIYVSGIRL